MLKGAAEGLVDALGFVVTLSLLVGLLFEAEALFSCDVQLGVAVGVSMWCLTWTGKGGGEGTYALTISFLETKTSKRSQRPGLVRDCLARGDIIWGWP